MDYQEAAALLRAKDQILILTHRRPDGDTIGCAAGLCRALRAQGKTAWVLENPEATALFTPYLEGLTASEDVEPGFVVSVDIAGRGLFTRAGERWLKQGIDLDAETVDERVITEAVGEFFTGDHFDISVDPDNPRVFADDEDISEAIRSSEVSSHVSKVSNVIPVRNVLIAAQRAYIAREASADSFSGGLGIVAEGRDITTVVRSVRPVAPAKPSRAWVLRMWLRATRPIPRSPAS